jgi:hypothetical protein
MDRVLYAVFYAIGTLIAIIFEGIFHLVQSRPRKPTALSLPLPIRFEHMHVIAGSGHGKT